MLFRFNSVLLSQNVTNCLAKNHHALCIFRLDVSDYNIYDIKREELAITKIYLLFIDMSLFYSR